MVWRMKMILLLLVSLPAAAQLKSGPPLPHKLVPDWAQLPKGYNFGECSGVDVDRNGNVWVFNRGAWPLIQFDRHGKMLQAFDEDTIRVKSSHGVKVDPDGNLWLADVKGHTLLKVTPAGRVLLVLGRSPGNNDSKDAFNEPTGFAFAADGSFYVSDGYVNQRVIQFTKAGEYIRHWGKKGTADGEFNLVHDVAVDSKGRVYVADRTNARIQVFTPDGKFLGKWTDIGNPWGLAYTAKEDALYMADGTANRIVKLNLDGQILGVLGSYGKAPGKLDFVHHIAVDQEGSIYVVEIKNWRVQKFSPR
jgi:DNA-binding beta-propeller fold protein YncE